VTDPMWLFVIFDLPSVTDSEKKAHARFRNGLLRRGFCMLQWSVYARCYDRERSAESDREVIATAVPRGGRVRMISITDRQFGRMTVIDGYVRKEPEKRLEQVVVFD